MNKTKLKKLNKYAKDKGYQIDEAETKHLREALSDTTITLKIPSRLKEILKTKAAEKDLPYQRYLKSLLIDKLEEDKKST